MKILKLNYSLKSIGLLSIFFLLQLQNINGQGIEWQQNYGGSGSDRCNKIIHTSDGGYLMLGNSGSRDGDISDGNGDFDYWLVKLFSNGEIEWEKSYGGDGRDVGIHMIEVKDDGYIINGQSRSLNGDVSGNNVSFDLWVVKLTYDGEIEWENSYGGSEVEGTGPMLSTADGGYIIASVSNSTDGDVVGNNGATDYWILKLDRQGSIEWTKNYGGSDRDISRAIHQTSDNGFLILGYTVSNDGDIGGNNGNADYWLIKLDAKGELEWEKNYGGSGSDVGNHIHETSDQGFMLIGSTSSDDGDISQSKGGSDFWIVKIDKAGTIEWDKNYGGFENEFPRSLYQTSDNEIVICGTSESRDGDVGGNYGESDCWLVKIDEEGEKKWEQNYGGSGEDGAHGILQTIDNGFIIAGYSDSDDIDVGDNKGDFDFWVVKIAPLQTNVEDHLYDKKILIYPNPTSGEFVINFDDVNSKIDVAIFNGLGKLVYSRKAVSTSLEINGIPSGTYYLKIKGTDFIQTKKLIIQ